MIYVVYVYIYIISNNHIYLHYVPCRENAHAQSHKYDIDSISSYNRAFFSDFGSLVKFVQESYDTPLEHTPGNPPTQLWKDSLYDLLVKV